MIIASLKMIIKDHFKRTQFKQENQYLMEGVSNEYAYTARYRASDY